MRLRNFIPFALIAASLVAGCSKTDFLNFTIPKSGYKKYPDIAYGTNDRQKLDVYVPDQLIPSHSVIVFYYGGSWQMGSKKDYLFAAQAFAEKGYIVVIPDYRLYPEVYFPAFMYDSAAAFAWVQKHIKDYNGNPEALFIAGHSAGGFNAAMLAVQEKYLEKYNVKSSDIKGVIGIAAPLDFLPLEDPKIIALFSKEPDANTQPINYVHKGLPPFFLATGDSDKEVYPKNTINFAAKLRKENVEVVEKHYKDTGHIGIVLSLARGFRGGTPLLQDIDNFIQQHP